MNLENYFIAEEERKKNKRAVGLPTAPAQISLSTYDMLRLKKEHKRQLMEGDTDKNDFNDWHLSLK